MDMPTLDRLLLHGFLEDLMTYPARELLLTLRMSPPVQNILSTTAELEKGVL